MKHNSSAKTFAGILVFIAVVVGVCMVVNHSSSEPAPAGDISQIPVSVTVTQDSNNKTISVQQGTNVVLSLGDLSWSVTVSDATILSRIKNIAVLKGSQGVYQTLRPGTVEVAAQGRPVCKDGEMCAQYIVAFKTTIQVTK